MDSIQWTPFLVQTVAALGAAVGGWVLVFLATICCQTNEIHVARRQLAITSVVALLEGVALLMVLAFETMVLRRPVWPHLGIVLPVVMIVVTGLASCINSHVLFRWTQLLLQPTGIVMFVLAAAQEDVQIRCLEAGTCLTTAGPAAGWTLPQLYQLRWARLAACMAGGWVMLSSGFLLASLGCCWPRYSPRLFSSEHPLSALPARKGREHRTAESRGMAAALRRVQAAGGTTSMRARRLKQHPPDDVRVRVQS